MRKSFPKKLFLSFLIIAALLAFESNKLSFSQESLVSIDVENAPIDQVLKMIASQSGLNIVTSQNVSGTVSVKLDNVSLERALDSILKINNYMYSKDGDIITIYTYADAQQEERFANLITKVFTLDHTDVMDLRRALLSMKTSRGKIELSPKSNQVIITDTPTKIKEMERALKLLDQKTVLKKYKLEFARASDLMERLTRLIPPEKGQVFVDERTNSVVVKATPVVLKDADELISGWDVQHKQVLIEARLMEVNLDKTLQLGIRWEYDNTTRSPQRVGMDLKEDLSVDLAKGTILNIGTLTSDEYNIILEALETSGDAEVLSAPRICVLDNEEANILVGSSEPYIITSEDPVTGFVTESTEYIDVGIKLIVTPQIGENGYITMVIHPEVSKARRLPDVDNAVAIDTTQADTTMMVRDGETIVLGGLIKNKQETVLRKIPFLGDIPLLGLLFRSKEEETIKQELIVFITPHILTDRNRQIVSQGEWHTFTDRTGTEKRMATGLLREPLMPDFEQESF